MEIVNMIILHDDYGNRAEIEEIVMPLYMKRCKIH